MQPRPKTEQSAAEVRAAARAGEWHGGTRDAAPGHLQCNVVMLPEDWAREFDAWCAANRSVAPVIARSRPGDPGLPSLGADIDIRTDLPRYRVFRHGAPAGDVDDIDDLWNDELVTFAFGCSFTLEEALRRAGISLAYEERGFGGAIYSTALETAATERFAGPLVVSMRPLSPDDARAARDVSARHPQLHGAPVHSGDPSAIGVDLGRPLDAIGEIDIAAGEVPVFWACGVTPQLALERARPPLAITHLSAHMLVTDVRLEELDSLPPVSPL
jgi:uncharacterized protein YcsI (UPF0317 family)